MNKYEEALDVIARYISDSKYGITRYSENTINEKLSHLKELIDKEEKALDKACARIVELEESNCGELVDIELVKRWSLVEGKLDE